MKKNTKNILVTCALPYSNGPIHLGHLLEHIQADIWVRFHKMKSIQIYFICSDDAHGTPIMLQAEKLKISPEKLVKKTKKEHQEDFLKFNINHDCYHTTHSKENFNLLISIYKKLKKNKLINYDIVTQLYDPVKKMFLPDRFVKGTCPVCYSEKQYGDHCEICSSSYNISDLINPYSVITHSKPILRKSEHIFFNLPKFSSILKIWIKSGVLQKEIVNKIMEWLKIGLKKWDISRNEPYFGFKIPNEKNKYFYVWIDASIGYISTHKKLCKNKNIKFNNFWKKKSNDTLYHFIGKDIIYFHSLFWPAILEGISFRKPTKIFVHGHLTINKKKMSKSKNNFITAKDWLKYLDSDSLRYYYSTKLSQNINDIDLNLLDFMNTINTNLINKIINIASRSAKFINNLFNNTLSNDIEDVVLYRTFINANSEIEKYFYNLKFSHVIRKIIFLSELANQYIDKKSPWKLIKIENKKKELHSICSMAINLFRILIIYLKPIVPSIAKETEKFFKEKLSWKSLHKPLLNYKINHFSILYKRITKEQIEAILNHLKN